MPLKPLALATQRDLPDWEVDDAPFHEALDAAGIHHQQVIWDDPTVDWSAYRAVLIRTTWDYAGKRAAFVRWVDRVSTLTRLFNPPEVVHWSTDKRYLRDLEQAGVPIAPTVWLERGTTPDIAALCRERGWGRGFLKPIFGQTARETLRFEADSDGFAAAQAHVRRLLPDEGMILQPYLARVEQEGEHSAIYVDNQCTHVVQKLPPDGDYRVMDDFGGTDRPSSLDEAGLAICRRALAAVPSPDPLLYARVDLLRDDDSGWVLTELELVEPSLFFRHAPASATTLVTSLRSRFAALEI